MCARPIRAPVRVSRAAMAVAIDRRGPEVNAEDLR